MEVKILINEKNTMELEMVGGEQSLAQLLAERLNEDKDVDFASYKVEHPIVGNPKVYVRTKKGEPGKIVLEKLAEIKKELEEFRSQFSDIVK